MILETPLDEAWADALDAAAGARTLAGHTGTAVLEEADDDTHTATPAPAGRRARTAR